MHDVSTVCTYIGGCRDNLVRHAEGKMTYVYWYPSRALRLPLPRWHLSPENLTPLSASVGITNQSLVWPSWHRAECGLFCEDRLFSQQLTDGYIDHRFWTLYSAYLAIILSVPICSIPTYRRKKVPLESCIVSIGRWLANKIKQDIHTYLGRYSRCSKQGRYISFFFPLSC